MFATAISNIIFERLQKNANVLVTQEKILLFNVWLWDKTEIQQAVENSLKCLERDKSESSFTDPKEEIVVDIINFIENVKDNFEKFIVKSGCFYVHLNSINEHNILECEPDGTYCLRPSSTIKNSFVATFKDGSGAIKPIRIKITINNELNFLLTLGHEDSGKKSFIVDSSESLNKVIQDIYPSNKLKPLKLYGGTLPSTIFRMKLNEIKQNGLDQEQVNHILEALFIEHPKVKVLPLYADFRSSLENDLNEQISKHKQYFKESDWLIFCFPAVIGGSQSVNHAVGVAINFREKTVHYQDDFWNELDVKKNEKFFKETVLDIIYKNTGINVKTFQFMTRFNKDQPSSQNNCTIRTINFLERLIKKTQKVSLDDALSMYYETWVTVHKKEQENLVYHYNALEIALNYLKQNLNPVNLNKVNINPSTNSHHNTYGWKIGRGILTLFWTSHHFFNPRIGPQIPELPGNKKLDSTTSFTFDHKGQSIKLNYQNFEYGSYYSFDEQNLKKLMKIVISSFGPITSINPDEIIIKELQDSLVDTSILINAKEKFQINSMYSQDGNFLEVTVKNIITKNSLKFIQWIKNIYLLTAQIKYISGEILTLHLEKNKSLRDKVLIVHEVLFKFQSYVDNLIDELSFQIKDIKTDTGVTLNFFRENPLLNCSGMSDFKNYIENAQKLVLALEYDLPDTKAQELFKTFTGQEISTTSQAYFTPKLFIEKSYNERPEITQKEERISIPLSHGMIERVRKRVKDFNENVKKEYSASSDAKQLVDALLTEASQVEHSIPNFKESHQESAARAIRGSSLSPLIANNQEESRVSEEVNQEDTKNSLWKLCGDENNSSELEMLFPSQEIKKFIQDIQEKKININLLSKQQEMLLVKQLENFTFDLEKLQNNIRKFYRKEALQKVIEHEIALRIEFYEESSTQQIDLANYLMPCKEKKWFELVTFFLKCAELTKNETQRHQYLTAAMMVAVVEQGSLNALVDVYLLILLRLIGMQKTSALTGKNIVEKFKNRKNALKIEKAFDSITETLNSINDFWNSYLGPKRDQNYLKDSFNTIFKTKKVMQRHWIWLFLDKTTAEFLLKTRAIQQNIAQKNLVILRIGTQPDTIVATYFDDSGNTNHLLLPNLYCSNLEEEIPKFNWHKILLEMHSRFENCSENTPVAIQRPHYFSPKDLILGNRSSSAVSSSLNQPDSPESVSIKLPNMQHVQPNTESHIQPMIIDDMHTDPKDIEVMDIETINLEKVDVLNIEPHQHIEENKLWDIFLSNHDDPNKELTDLDKLISEIASKKISVFKLNDVAREQLQEGKINLVLVQNRLIKLAKQSSISYDITNKEKIDDLITSAKNKINLSNYLARYRKTAWFAVVEFLFYHAALKEEVEQKNLNYTAAMMIAVAVHGSIKILLPVYLLMLHQIQECEEISELTVKNIHSKFYDSLPSEVKNKKEDEKISFSIEKTLTLVNEFWNTYNSSYFSISFDTINKYKKLFQSSLIWLFLKKEDAEELLNIYGDCNSKHVLFRIGTQAELLVASYSSDGKKIEHFLLPKVGPQGINEFAYISTFGFEKFLSEKNLNYVSYIEETGKLIVCVPEVKLNSQPSFWERPNQNKRKSDEREMESKSTSKYIN